MTKKSESNTISPNNSKEHLANERTFLAWIRTSIGIMAFGFVVEKFALFLKQIAYFFSTHDLAMSQELSSKHQHYSSLFGIFLVGFGALIALISFINYRRIGRQIEENRYDYSSLLSVIVTGLVILTGCFLVVYLIYT